jgi:AraC family transcriptional regulator
MLENDIQYDSMAAFYRAAYSETLVEVSEPVALGTTLIAARQGAGDYSDAAVPDLVITRGLSRVIPATLDLGAGQFRTAMPRNAMVAIAPDTPTKILLDRPNEIEMLAIPYAALRELCAIMPCHRTAISARFTARKIESPQLTQVFRVAPRTRSGPAIPTVRCSSKARSCRWRRS